MSFLNGVKKNLNRAGQSIMQRTGASDKTTDSEFQEEYERFKSLEKQSEKLAKEAKGYIESVEAMTAAQVRIQQTIEQFYSDRTTMGPEVTDYKEAVEKLEKESKDFRAEYSETVTTPLAKYCAFFPEINEAVKRRQKKLLDYDTQRSKVRKLIDKPKEDPQILPRAEQEANLAREMYENINGIIVEDLPKFVKLRVPYLDPTFEALIKSELQFAKRSYEELEGRRDRFPDEKQYDGRVDDILDQMRALTICGNY